MAPYSISRDNSTAQNDPKRVRSLFRRIASSILLLLVLDASATATFWLAADLLLRLQQRPYQTGTAIVVFYPGEIGEGRLRASSAARLALHEPKSTLVFVGGARPQSNFIGSAAMAEVAIELGVNSERVMHDTSSNDTLSNVASAHAILSTLDAPQVILVADQLHLLRIKWLMASKGYSAYMLTHQIDEHHSWLAYIWRAHFELAAWASMLFPEVLRLKIIALMRA